MDRTTKIMSLICIVMVIGLLVMCKSEICDKSFWIDIISIPNWMKVR